MYKAILDFIRTFVKYGMAEGDETEPEWTPYKPRRIPEALPQRLRIYQYLHCPFRRQYPNHRLSGAVISTPRHRSSAPVMGPGLRSSCVFKGSFSE